MVGLVAAWAMVEPEGTTQAAPPLAQLRSVFRGFRHATLRWAFVYTLAMTALIHLPYELVQPWLDALMAKHGLNISATPPLAGLVVGAAMAMASIASSRAPYWAERWGTLNVLVGAFVMLAFVMLAMAVGPFAWLVPIVALRSVPGAVSWPLVSAMAHGELDSGIRATWMSVQSLAGRLAFAAVLMVAAAGVGAEAGWTVSRVATAPDASGDRHRRRGRCYLALGASRMRFLANHLQLFGVGRSRGRVFGR